jgi:hypothetical protein
MEASKPRASWNRDRKECRRNPIEPGVLGWGRTEGRQGPSLGVCRRKVLKKTRHDLSAHSPVQQNPQELSVCVLGGGSVQEQQ